MEKEKLDYVKIGISLNSKLLKNIDQMINILNKKHGIRLNRSELIELALLPFLRTDRNAMIEYIKRSQHHIQNRRLKHKKRGRRKRL